MAVEKKRLTPIAIHDQQFKRRGRHGYDRYEVDSFLDRIVADYGSTLDENSDLKNQVYRLKQKNESLQKVADEYQNKKRKIEQAQDLVSHAQEKAKKIVADAKGQAKIDTEYQQQQKDTIAGDYKRLKKQIAAFRGSVQKKLQSEIDSLNDDNWQKSLDKYFKTERYYPDEGEPVEMVDPSEVDNDDQDEVNSDQEVDDAPDDVPDDEVDAGDWADADAYADDEDLDPETDDENLEDKGPKPLSGDSPQRETERKRPEAKPKNDGGATIVFPQNYKDHK